MIDTISNPNNDEKIKNRSIGEYFEENDNTSQSISDNINKNKPWREIIKRKVING